MNQITKYYHDVEAHRSQKGSTLGDVVSLARRRAQLGGFGGEMHSRSRSASAGERLLARKSAGASREG